MSVLSADGMADVDALAKTLGGFDRVNDVHEGELSDSLPGARACVLGYRGASLEEHLDELARLCARFPTLAVVLVTDREPRVARLIAPIPLAAVVWWRDIDTRLVHAVEEALLASTYEQMAIAAERSDRSPALRRALALAIRRAPTDPIRTSRELAEAVSAQPASLAQAFRRRAPTGHTLGGFLSALLILRAHQLKAAGFSGKAIEQELAISRQALLKKAHDWPDTNLKDLSVARPRDLMRRFAHEWLDPLP